VKTRTRHQGIVVGATLTRNTRRAECVERQKSGEPRQRVEGRWRQQACRLKKRWSHFFASKSALNGQRSEDIANIVHPR
jgi:hypothetical protein